MLRLLLSLPMAFKLCFRGRNEKCDLDSFVVVVVVIKNIVEDTYGERKHGEQNWFQKHEENTHLGNLNFLFDSNQQTANIFFPCQLYFEHYSRYYRKHKRREI